MGGLGHRMSSRDGWERHKSCLVVERCRTGWGHHRSLMGLRLLELRNRRRIHRKKIHGMIQRIQIRGLGRHKTSLELRMKERHKTSLGRIHVPGKLRASRIVQLGVRLERVRAQFRQRVQSCIREDRTGSRWLGLHIGLRFRDHQSIHRRTRILHDHRLRAGSLVGARFP
jgi:3'-phosphoadenosine 5'-phosphosulfate sulfotransferase